MNANPLIKSMATQAAEAFGQPAARAAAKSSLAPPEAEGFAAVADAAAKRERERLGKDAARGQKVLAGAVQAGKSSKVLTPEQQDEARAERDKLILNTKCSMRYACRTVAEKFKCSYKTIERL